MGFSNSFILINEIFSYGLEKSRLSFSADYKQKQRKSFYFVFNVLP